YSFSLLSFLGRLGDFASSSCLLVHCFDDTHSNRLSHVTNSKTAQRRIVREALNTHRFARNHINNGSIPRFQELGTIFQLLSRTTIYLFLQLSKLASNVSCVTIQHRCISSTDLAWMVQDNHLSCEASCFHWCISTDFTSVVTLTGAKVTTIPGLRTPVSTRPTGTVPIPPIL
uniref:Uncharacterized protein n=1 Tax=Canis lupus familiaris TaxID=9615 RepID=A0A8C0T091_CANLF